MAPALTSDAVLDTKAKEAVSYSHVIENRKFTRAVDLGITKQSQISLKQSSGVKSSRMVRKIKRGKNGRKRISSDLALNSNAQFKKSSHANILRVSKKMNPNNGSSADKITNDSSSVDISAKRVERKTMCGPARKSFGHYKAPNVTNGENKMFIKKTEIKPDTPAQCVKPTSDIHLEKKNEKSCGESSETPTDKYANITSRNAILSKRARTLEKRVRRLQSKLAVSHVRNQIGGFVDHQKKLIEQQMVRQEASDPALNLRDAQNMSTSALVHLVQKWQSQQPMSRRHSKQQDGDNIVRLGEDLCTELDQLSGHLTSNIHHIENAVDSDATESSSGGESCDDGDFDYDWGEKTKPPLKKRVDWRWARDRCDIASRWTWLQAQVSDLEYRIRQQSEIYKQIRVKKGEVKLGESSESISSAQYLGKDTRLEVLQQSGLSPTSVSPLLSNIDKQSASLKKQIGNIYTPSPKQRTLLADVATTGGESITPNGLVTQAPLSSHSSQCSSPDAASRLTEEPSSLKSLLDPTNVAARCRPCILGKYRKRKLLRTSSLHTRSRKCARLSSVKCQCYPPAVPCAMCGGRYNNVRDGEQENCPVPEKIALLDHSYHQVLSLQEDISLSLHFQSLLKTGDWQQRLQSKAYAGQFNVEKRRGHYQIKEKRKSVKKTASLEVLSRIKSKYAAERVYSALPLSPDKKRLTRISDIRMRKKKAALQDALRKKDRKLGLVGSRSRSCVMYGNDSSTLREIKEHIRRKRTESAFDINNIVIPYSVAASTRVEKLQYKEILTPSWREINNTTVRSVEPQARQHPSSCDNNVRDTERETSAASSVIEPREDTAIPSDEFEDTSDEAFLARHERSEQEEKKKFSAYTTSVSQQQKRQRGRPSESAACIGVMTPDPSSPDVAETHTRATPPATQHAMSTSGSQASLHKDLLEDEERNEAVWRRRASSVSSTLSRSEGLRSCSEDNGSGWAPRTFPLNDIEYNHLFMDRPPEVKYALRASRAVHVPRTSTSKEVLLYEDSLALDSPPQSPSSSTSTGLEDDKEWTVKSVNSRHSSLILKIAKR